MRDRLSITGITSVLVTVVVLQVLTFGSSEKTEVFVTDMPDMSLYTSPYSAFVNPLIPSTANDLIEVWYSSVFGSSSAHSL